VITIFIPPLRERKDDIPLLVEHFLAKHRETLNKKVTHVSKEALNFLIDYPWPCNVRELENAIVRALVLCPSDCIQPRDLVEDLRKERKREEIKVPADKQELISMKKEVQKKIKEEMERKFIEEALKQERGNILRAAARVSMDRRQFQNLVKKYGIARKDFDEADAK
jgi:two-component system response regulator AtoC